MNKIWIEHYDAGVSKVADTSAYCSLVELFAQSKEKYSDLVAFQNMGAMLSYADLDKKSSAFAAYLQSLNLRKGDRVALMMPNVLQYPVALIGALKAGLVVVNVNPLYTPRELKHQLTDSQAKVLVVLENFAGTYAQIADTCPVDSVVTTQLGDLLPSPKRHLVNFVVKYVKKLAPKHLAFPRVTWPEALRVGCQRAFEPPVIEATDIAVLQYTGGTTGVSKGAVLTHGNLIANIQQVAEILDKQLVPGEDKVVTALPLYHIFALTVNCLTFLKYGATNLLITNPRDIPAFVKELSNYPFTLFTGVNTLFNSLLNDEGFRQLDFSNFKFAIGGGMAVQKPVADRWKEVTKTTLIEGYGLTETAPVVCVNPLYKNEFDGAAGLPLPSTDVKVVNEQGETLPIGEVGELCVKGPQVMLGYWQREKDTALVLNNGWLKTGDIARMDERGFVFIVDRKKDMILVSGFNVFPNEIEEVAVTHPDVVEAAAIGVKHEVSGEVVKLFVVARTDELSEKALLEHCRTLLAAYKIPKYIEFRDELPKTNVGKILRRELR